MFRCAAGSSPGCRVLVASSFRNPTYVAGSVPSGRYVRRMFSSSPRGSSGSRSAVNARRASMLDSVAYCTARSMQCSSDSFCSLWRTDIFRQCQAKATVSCLRGYTWPWVNVWLQQRPRPLSRDSLRQFLAIYGFISETARMNTTLCEIVLSDGNHSYCNFSARSSRLRIKKLIVADTVSLPSAKTCERHYTMKQVILC